VFFFRFASSLESTSLMTMASRGRRDLLGFTPAAAECLRAWPWTDPEVPGRPGDDFWRTMGEALEALVDSAPAEAKLLVTLTSLEDLAYMSEPSCGKRGIAKSVKSRVASRAPSIIGEVSRLLESMNGDSK